MSAKVVSFIIPAYNAADTIVRCLDSIYALPLKRAEFEVVVIDDASTDNTIETIEQYMRNLYSMTPSLINSLHILRQLENHRQGAARNRGVKVAGGEYICFVDADDAVTGGIVDAIRLAKEKQADMVALHSANINESGKIVSEILRMRDLERKEFSGIEMQNKYPYWCSAPWGYIYRRKFIEQVKYPFAEGVLFEDSDFVAVHLYFAKRMFYVSELGYKAYCREGSTTRHTSYKSVADYLLLGVRMMGLYELLKDEEKYESNQEKGQFAEGILEGACWNVEKSCKRMVKLGGLNEVKAFYERIDAHISRKRICKNERYRKYYWNAWTSLCLMHKRLSMIILIVLIPIYKLFR